MFISPKLAALAAAPFTLVCLGFAIHGFLQTGEITDPQQLSDARGFALFWLAYTGWLPIFSGGD